MIAKDHDNPFPPTKSRFRSQAAFTRIGSENREEREVV
jgi:hypothetical protein